MVNEYDARVDRPELFFGDNMKKKNYYTEIAIGILIMMMIVVLISR